MRTLAIVSVTSGAGASTLAALAFAATRDDARGAPGLFGTGGTGLVERCGGDEVGRVDPQSAIWDVGVCAASDALDLLRSGDVAVAVAAPATPLGTADALRLTAAIAEGDSALLARVAVVQTEVYGRQRGTTLEKTPAGAVLRLPFDRALARPGSVPEDLRALRRRTRSAVHAWRSYCGWALRS